MPVSLSNNNGTFGNADGTLNSTAPAQALLFPMSLQIPAPCYSKPAELPVDAELPSCLGARRRLPSVRVAQWSQYQEPYAYPPPWPKCPTEGSCGLCWCSAAECAVGAPECAGALLLSVLSVLLSVPLLLLSETGTMDCAGGIDICC